MRNREIVICKACQGYGWVSSAFSIGFPTDKCGRCEGSGMLMITTITEEEPFKIEARNEQKRNKKGV